MKLKCKETVEKARQIREQSEEMNRKKRDMEKYKKLIEKVNVKEMIQSRHKFNLGKNYTELENEQFKIDISEYQLRALERQEK